MRKAFIKLIIIVLLPLLISACAGQGSSKAKGSENGHRNANDTISASVIDSLSIGESYRLCTQVLTSAEVLERLEGSSRDSYDREATPANKAFLYLDKSLINFEPAKNCARRYNLNAVLNHVVHNYELFCRKSSEIEMAKEEDSTIIFTRKDTIALIKEDIIPIKASVLSAAFPDANDRKAARMLLAAYDRFDGDDSNGSILTKAVNEYRDYFSSIPEIIPEIPESFTDEFWAWYDKKPYVNEIDSLQALRISDELALTQEQLDHFKLAVESERDIEKRTILALEYAQWDCDGASILLGEILESGQYTRYLTEAWITWRAAVQMSYLGPSSFCVIPNNFYDSIRCRCINTILRHMKDTPDKYDASMLEYLIISEMLHRQASFTGNESMKILSDLKYGWFVHPRVFEMVKR